MISLPNNFVTDLVAVVYDLTGDIMPLVLLILGVAFGTWILSDLFWNFKEREYERYFKDKYKD